jgi:predicted nucleic acid-binding protein
VSLRLEEFLDSNVLVYDFTTDPRALCRTVLPMDVETHTDALRIAERYGYATFDALIVASALRANCDVLWSEDMQDGIVIDRRLRIANPFRVT